MIRSRTEAVKRSVCGMGKQELQRGIDASNASKRDAGKLINTVSHQLKRQMCSHEAEDSLTNMQRHVLHYILFESLKRDI